MTNSKPLARGLFVTFLLAGLLAGILAPMFASVQAAPQQQAATLTIIINEVGWMGTKASSTDEWIELYNPSSSQPVTLTGWQLVGITGSTNVFSISLAGSIPAGGYFVLARNSLVFQNVTINQTSSNLSLLNSNETLKLIDSTSALVDTANSAGGAWPAGLASPSYASMERIGIISDSPTTWVTYAGPTTTIKDRNGNFVQGTPGQANWATTVTVTPSPTSTYTPTNTSTSSSTFSPTPTTSTPTSTVTATPCPSSYHSLLINEVAWMGTKASSSDEWVELYNLSSCAIDLTNWSLVGANYYYTSGNFTITFPSGYIIAPGGYFVVAANPGVFQTAFTSSFYSTSALSLLNSYQSLQLRSPTGSQVDTANYAGNYYWPAGTASPNYASMERYGQLDDGPAAWVTYAGPSGPTSTNVKDRNGNYVLGTPGGPNWSATVTITPSPLPTATVKVRPPTPIPPTPFAHVVINEFLPRAGFDWNNDGVIDVNDEFIEIENLGPINVNLSGWKLSDDPNIGGKTFALPSQTLKPGERAVFYGSTTHILLVDSGDTIRLTNSRGVIVDARGYGVVKYPDQSHCRIPDGNGYWQTTCFPTPGNKNMLTGVMPASPPAKINQPAPCLLPDTTPLEFRLAVCSPYGADIWNDKYWNDSAGQKQFIIPDPFGKGEIIME